jgi:hypothetical protein
MAESQRCAHPASGCTVTKGGSHGKYCGAHCKERDKPANCATTVSISSATTVDGSARHFALAASVVLVSRSF